MRSPAGHRAIVWELSHVVCLIDAIRHRYRVSQLNSKTNKRFNVHVLFTLSFVGKFQEKGNFRAN